MGIAEEDTTPGGAGSLLKAQLASRSGDLAFPGDLSDTVAFGTTTRRNVRSPTPAPDGPPGVQRPLGGIRYDRAHRIRIGDAEPIVLDRPVLIGRSPRLPRISGGVEHQLVRVDSPKREVSGSHIELSQHGGVVVARDLRATNGSRVLTPGGVPRVLTHGESVVVAPGTTIDIGDGNVIWFLGVPGASAGIDGVPS